jgi:hypothetical protein
VKALAEELLEVESVDADRLKEILAGSVLAAPSPFPPAVRDAPTEASRPT